MNQINELSKLITITMNGNLKVDPPTAGELAAAIIEDGWIDGNKLWGRLQARIENLRPYKDTNREISEINRIKEMIEEMKLESVLKEKL